MVEQFIKRPLLCCRAAQERREREFQSRHVALIRLQYAQEAGGAPPLLYQPTDPELLKKPPAARKFKAARSLRDVEPSVNLWVENPDGAFLDPVGEAEGST